MLVQARRYDTGESVELRIAQGAIVAITPIVSATPLPWIAPGFIDLQVNGYGGVGFNDADLTLAKIEQVAAAMASFGVTSFLPTITTDSPEAICRACGILRAACEQSPGLQRSIAGIHVEGPFISAEAGPRGAHPQEHVRPPEFAEFQRWQAAAGGRIRLVTLSPEYAAAPQFIEQVTAQGVVVAVGHTAANQEQISAAVAAGARLSTHLGNGAHPLIKRHPNYIWDQLAEDRLMASLIVDGHHLPPAVVKSMLRAKTPARCILVSDMTNLGGCLPGRYQTSLGDVEMLPNGKLVVAGQREIMAGASLPIGVGIANVMRFAGLDMKTAIELATRNPAQLLHLPEPKLALGSAAKLVLFHWNPGEDLRIERTINA